MADVRSFERTEYQQVKADLHRKFRPVGLEKLGRSAGDAAREEVLALIRSVVNSEPCLSASPSGTAGREISMRFLAGPLEPLLKDPPFPDILVNRFDKVFVERAGKLESTPLSSKTTRT